MTNLAFFLYNGLASDDKNNECLRYGTGLQALYKKLSLN